MKKIFALLKKLWIALPLTLLPAATNSDCFAYRPFSVGPIKKGENYSNSLKFRVLESGKSCKLEVHIYKEKPVAGIAEADWYSSQTQTGHYVGEDLTFSYTLPSAYIYDDFYLLFQMSFSRKVIGGGTTTSFREKTFHMESYSEVDDDTVSLTDNQEFVMPMWAEYASSEKLVYHKSALRFENGGGVIESEGGTLPFEKYNLFHFFDRDTGESVTMNLTKLNNLVPQLCIRGKEAKDFKNVAERYTSSIRGTLAYFSLEFKAKKSGYYYLSFKMNKYSINKFNGTLKKGTSDNTKEFINTSAFYLPPLTTSDKTYGCQFYTENKSVELGIPLLNKSFSLYHGSNYFGNCLNSKYCVGATYE